MATIGALTNVPEPGADIRSPWAQQLSAMGRHIFATKAALDAQWAAAPVGAMAYTTDTGTPWSKRAAGWQPDFHELRYQAGSAGGTITTAETFLAAASVPSLAFPYRAHIFATFAMAGPATGNGDMRIRYNTTGAAIAVTDPAIRSTRWPAGSASPTAFATVDRSTPGPLTVGALALVSGGTATASGLAIDSELIVLVTPLYA